MSLATFCVTHIFGTTHMRLLPTYVDCAIFVSHAKSITKLMSLAPLTSFVTRHSPFVFHVIRQSLVSLFSLTADVPFTSYVSLALFVSLASFVPFTSFVSFFVVFIHIDTSFVWCPSRRSRYARHSLLPCSCYSCSLVPLTLLKL